MGHEKFIETSSNDDNHGTDNISAINSGSLKIESEWLISKEAARYLGITERSLYNLTSNGKIPYYKFGKRNRYLLEDLRNLLLSQPRGGN
ncbi:MAG: helix-turn-helix domain-containing protein [Bdellovibrionaceae bacterium]|nr:helix-turn-helix domain-containing protein [Pseudobdellovibrionaceae bacterium]